MSREYEGFLIEADNTFGYVHIKPQGKGSVVNELRGAWTNVLTAQKAIDSYLLNKEEQSNASTKPTARGK